MHTAFPTQQRSALGSSSIACKRHVQVVPAERAEEEHCNTTAKLEHEQKAAEQPALPVRVRHHGLHQGIVSRPGIHGLEEQLLDEIDTAGKLCQQSARPSGEQGCAQEMLTSEQLWSSCAAKVPDWSYWYTTYHHFRSKV